MPQAYNPHPYQLNGIQLICGRDHGALFLDPGLGKTSISLAAYLVLKEANAVARMIVIAPLRPARLVWPVEVAKWTDFAHLRVSLVLGTEKQRKAAMQADADIYVVNCENTDWLFANYGEFGAHAPEMLVVDESTRFKNPQSKRFKALKDNISRFARRYILTGTPTPQSIEDLFSQTYICDGGVALGQFITRFRREFCWAENIHVGGGRVIQKWHPKADAAERVYQRINGMALRLKAEDYLNMPDRLDNQIAIELPAGIAKQYAALEKDLFVATEGGNTMAPANAAAALMKLRQIVNGVAYTENQQGDVAIEPLHDAKLEALAELIEEQSGSPLLVAVSFLPEVEAIRAHLGVDVPYLGGGVSAKRADEIVAAWNRGEIPVLLAHPSSVAHGLNLQAGGHAVCWFGLTWNLEEYIQFNARVYRQGQSNTVVIHHIVAANTIDGDILEALTHKASAQAAILNALKGRQS